MRGPTVGFDGALAKGLFADSTAGARLRSGSTLRCKSDCISLANSHLRVYVRASAFIPVLHGPTIAINGSWDFGAIIAFEDVSCQHPEQQ